jgi:nucleotide-binding universal stress UspA family protein
MLPVRRILVPINFTEACRTTARFAIDLASVWAADVCLVHVVEPVGSAVGFESAVMLEESMRAQRKRAGREMEEFLNLQPSPNLQRLLLDGDPAGEIVRLAHNEKYNLIVMPTRGYGVFRRLLLGSVTAKVLHDADCPVWTGVHPEAFTADGVVSIRRVACAVDLGPQTRTALNWAAAFAADWKAEMSILHILPSVPEISWRDRLETMAREQINACQNDLGLKADVQLEFGHMPGALTDLVKRMSPDVLIIGRGHFTMGARLRGGAYAVIRDSPCPVVSV